MSSAVARTVRVGTWAVVGTFAVLGLVTAGRAVIVPLFVAPLAGGLVGWAMARYQSVRPAAACALIMTYAAAAGVGVLAVAGFIVIAGPGAIPAALVLGGVLVWTRRPRTPMTTAAPFVPDMAAPLTGLTSAQLARAWQASYGDLGHARDAGTLERVCALRKRQLDEIERRDPAGFHRWISSGNWVRGDSAPFLGG